MPELRNRLQALERRLNTSTTVPSTTGGSINITSANYLVALTTLQREVCVLINWLVYFFIYLYVYAEDGAALQEEKRRTKEVNGCDEGRHVGSGHDRGRCKGEKMEWNIL